MYFKYVLCISAIILQTQSFYTGNDAKLWPNDKPAFTYDSLDDGLIKNNIPERNDTQIIKDKITSLIVRTKEDVSEKIKTIDKVHRNLESNSLYKVGYIVNFLNSTYENFIKLYENIDKNEKDWSVLKLLEQYEQVKSTENFVTQMLRVLHSLMSRRDKFSVQDTRDTRDTRDNRANPYESSIAWSYYDDAGQ